ncbi:MAG: hypothetical protein R3B70_07310 [Polyangiaceae bacterium]
MKHTIPELIDIARTYYPPGVPGDDARYKQSPEYSRLAAARRGAGANNRQWRTLLQQASEQFSSDVVHNDSLHLPTGTMDAAYSGKVFVKTGTEDLTIAFLISFVAPYYLLYSHRAVLDPVKESASGPRFRLIFEGDTCTILPAEGGDMEEESAQNAMLIRSIVRFDFSAEEKLYSEWLAQKIEATWGYERMPPELGAIVVPDIATEKRAMGEATLYDCLFSDDCPLFPTPEE